MTSTLDRVRALVEVGDYLVSNHGYNELADDGIRASEVIATLAAAVLVEDYADAVRGPSCLLLQQLEDGAPAHVVWGLPTGSLRPAVLITAYRPDIARWSSDWMKRRR